MVPDEKDCEGHKTMAWFWHSIKTQVGVATGLTTFNQYLREGFLKMMEITFFNVWAKVFTMAIRHIDIVYRTPYTHGCLDSSLSMTSDTSERDNSQTQDSNMQKLKGNQKGFLYNYYWNWPVRYCQVFENIKSFHNLINKTCFCQIVRKMSVNY